MDIVPAVHMQEFTPTVAESDCFFRCKPSFLLNCFQIVAGEHSEMMGAGNHAMHSIYNAYWVLSRVHVKINGDIKAYQNVTCKTYPFASGRAFCLRDYCIVDGGGKKYAEASSMWTVLDAKTHTLRSVDSINLKAPDKFFSDTPMFTLGKLPQFCDGPDCEWVYDYRASYTDLDVNMHINNARYADFMLNAFTLKELTAGKVNEFCINYLKEIKEGDTISIYRRLLMPGCYLVYGIDKGTSAALFAAQVWLRQS